jgi:uncharacterized protein YqjF (DUF2071 family)
MANGKQLQMTMRDMLFVSWAVEPERARKLIGQQLELDTLTDSAGREWAVVSAVCFNVAELRSSAFPLGSLSFGQINYRIYVKAGDVPAVCFLDMKVNSRMVTTLTSFLGVPIHFEDIEIGVARDAAGSVRYTINSNGLRVDAVDGHDDMTGSVRPSPGFITDRLVGYVLAGESIFKIDVEQSGLDSVSARVVSAGAPRLEQLGLLDSDESVQPVSVLYVRESLFAADMPTRM